MSEPVPLLIDPASMAGRALCVAARGVDALLSCGGALALHARHGERPTVLVLAAPGEGSGESEAALAPAFRRLGVEDLRVDTSEDPAAALARVCAELDPALVYAPLAAAVDPARRRVARAVAGALAGSDARRLMLYGLRVGVPAPALLDVATAQRAKRAALEALAPAPAAVAARSEALDRSRALVHPLVLHAEAFAPVAGDALEEFGSEIAREAWVAGGDGELPAATAVLSSFNKREDLRENLRALLAQELPFARVVVVDNASSDGTGEMLRAEFPEVHLIEMPHSRFGACETFNIGFAASRTPLTAILDDDIVMPPDWLAKAVRRLVAEPETTAILSTKVVEPGMPASHRDAVAVNAERYMSTFRGCASLAWTQALREAEFYDERLFIYGNERDLTCRLLNLGYRVLQFPGVEVFHRTPFGLKPGARSLYYHARNAWLTMLKYAPAADLVRMPWLVFSRVVLRSGGAEARGEVSDAVGTIGTAAALRETPGAWWIVCKAAFSVLVNVPYCLRRRRPVRADDFELPLR
ncbi:MAG TPA: glycosyltransferase [Planctomycetota bacterium]|nr:glycosyltransferase [Planctomycetota bacterium]